MSKPGFGGSPFGSTSTATSIPSEFAPLVTAYQKVNKLSTPLKTTIRSADQEYEKQTDPSTPVPSAPVYAARLNGLLKTLANAESAVAECVKAREGLVSGLESLLNANRSALENERSIAAQLTSRKAEIEDKKHQVEVGIMRALGPADSNGSPGQGDSSVTPPEPDRPEIEALTPPAFEPFEAPTPEALTPEGEPVAAPSTSPVPVPPPPPPAAAAAAAVATTSEDKEEEEAPSYQSLPISANGSNKRRRVDTEEFPDLGGDDGIDADVAEMLKGQPQS
jgi:regulator of Ty1 transposition protein 103